VVCLPDAVRIHGRFVPRSFVPNLDDLYLCSCQVFCFKQYVLIRLSRVFEIKYQNLVFPSEIVSKLDSLNNSPEFQVPVILLVYFMMLSNYGHTHRAQQFTLTYVVKCGCYVISSLGKTKSKLFNLGNGNTVLYIN